MRNASMNNISQYKQVDRVSGVTEASPHKLVLMLLEGALEKLAIVKGLIMRKDMSSKGALIGQTIAIVCGLHSSLNKDAGGEIAENLDNLYDYIERQLLKANIDNDVQIIDEVAGLLREVKNGWETIPEDIRNTPLDDLTVAP